MISGYDCQDARILAAHVRLQERQAAGRAATGAAASNLINW